jgi:hypothetical protein
MSLFSLLMLGWYGVPLCSTHPAVGFPSKRLWDRSHWLGASPMASPMDRRMPRNNILAFALDEIY